MSNPRRFSGIFRIADAAAELDRITAEARTVATTYRTNRDLTDDGKRNAFESDHRRPKWAAELQEIAERVSGALDGAGERAAAARAKMTAPKLDTQAAILAELRHARRAESIRAAISDNPANAARLIADAAPEDVPLLAEELQNTGGTSAPLVADAVERGLRERSPEYAAAVDATAKVPEARRWTEAKIAAATEAMLNLDAAPNAGGPLATVPVDALGELASLEG